MAGTNTSKAPRTGAPRAKKSLLETVYRTPVGHAVAVRAGLSDPPRLRRGRGAMPTGAIALGVMAGGTLVAQTLASMGITTTDPLLDVADQRTKDEFGREKPPAYHARLGALVVDATGVRSLDQLESLRAMLRPAMRGLERSGRIVIVADDASAVEGLEAKALAQSLDGIMRTVGKELRGGSSCNLVRVQAGVDADDLRSTLAFLLEGRSAFVDGQTITLSPRKPGDDPGPDYDPAHPFAGRVVVVTGAARGIGAAIADRKSVV